MPNITEKLREWKGEWNDTRAEKLAQLLLRLPAAAGSHNWHPTSVMLDTGRENEGGSMSWWQKKKDRERARKGPKVWPGCRKQVQQRRYQGCEKAILNVTGRQNVLWKLTKVDHFTRAVRRAVGALIVSTGPGMGLSDAMGRERRREGGWGTVGEVVSVREKQILSFKFSKSNSFTLKTTHQLRSK